MDALPWAQHVVGCAALDAAGCVFLQAVMVLVFMFGASWRLTVVTFVLVPCVLVISKVRI
jgi:ABC-type multidrug transport system fused ATPase/permease subunit